MSPDPRVPPLCQNTMNEYTAHLELNRRDTNEDLAIDLMESLAAYHPAVGQSPRGWLSITITLPAATLAQATSSALAVVHTVDGSEVVALEVMTVDEFDAREGGGATGGERLTTEQVATLRRVSRPRVQQMIDEGKFQTARKEKPGNVWTVERREVEANLPRKVGDPVPSFDYQGVQLGRLNELDTEDLVELNERLNAAYDDLGFYEGDTEKLMAGGSYTVWLAHVGAELERRGVAS